jgi:hypothetical protein
MLSFVNICVVLLIASSAAGGGASSEAGDGSAAAADRRGVAAELERQLARNNEELRLKREEAMKALLAAREKVHQEHMRRHRLVDPDEHAELTDDTRRKFIGSRRDLFLKEAPQSFTQTLLMIVIVTFPLVIFVVWLRL